MVNPLATSHNSDYLNSSINSHDESETFLHLLNLPKAVRKLVIDFFKDEDLCYLSEIEEKNFICLKEHLFEKLSYTCPRIIPYGIQIRISFMMTLLPKITIIIDQFIESFKKKQDEPISHFISYNLPGSAGITCFEKVQPENQIAEFNNFKECIPAVTKFLIKSQSKITRLIKDVSDINGDSGSLRDFEAAIFNRFDVSNIDIVIKKIKKKSNLPPLLKPMLLVNYLTT